ncbi:hypothetical protein [Phenylobacterium sp.]|uniref:hypothetical protein n=1 Tax=Phenylobacterium sp. TaxID=1871053 RepID=UPI002F3E333A
MRKVLTAAMAAITLGGAVCATAAPAQARPHGYSHYGHYYGHNNAGAAVAAGVVGLALGAAIASNHGYYNRGYYGGYYGAGYYPAYSYGYAYAPPAYRVCESTRWVWDPYIGRNVPVATRYAC